MVTSVLEAAKHEQRHQVADVQARCGRIEAAIQGERPLGQVLGESISIGGLRHQSAPAQFGEEIAIGRQFVMTLRLFDIGHAQHLCSRQCRAALCGLSNPA